MPTYLTTCFYILLSNKQNQIHGWGTYLIYCSQNRVHNNRTRNDAKYDICQWLSRIANHQLSQQNLPNWKYQWTLTTRAGIPLQMYNFINCLHMSWTMINCIQPSAPQFVSWTRMRVLLSHFPVKHAAKTHFFSRYVFFISGHINWFCIAKQYFKWPLCKIIMLPSKLLQKSNQTSLEDKVFLLFSSWW